MRKYAPFLLVCALLVGGYLFWAFNRGLDKAIEHEYGSHSSERIKPNHQTGQHRQAPPKPTQFPEKITLLPVATATDQLHSSERSVDDDLSIIQNILRGHRQALGTNPVGLNDEITAALAGKNTKGAACLPPDHPAISDSGELLDRWGTPYRFHAYSGTIMKVSSAGPDRKHFTKDDVSLTE